MIPAMDRRTPAQYFRQSLKSEAYHADEIINIYLLRPLASVIVWMIYPTRIAPNHVTIAAIVVGCAAAWVYLIGTPVAIAAAGLLVTMKDIIDDADGQLARAKQLYSRRGRFLDSIGDFVVDVMLFASITAVVCRLHPGIATIAVGILALSGLTLRVSYHVFYQVSFLHREERYMLNRIVEKITEDDRRGDRVALRLQVIFNWIYKWQDTMMIRVDDWCGARRISPDRLKDWYSDRIGLRLSGLLGFGTELGVLTVCSLVNQLYVYLWLNLFLMNAIWVASILYRRIILLHSLTR